LFDVQRVKIMTKPHHEIFGIHRMTLLVIAIAISFGSFSVFKALGGTSTEGRTERSEVPAVTASVSGTALAAGVDVSRTTTNPLASATRLTNAPRPAVKTTLTPIEQIQVGDRVLAESPTGEEDTTFGSEIIPADWRKLTLRAPKRDGTVANVVLLRPLMWLNEQHGKVGGTVFISVPECGIDGNAEVLAIDPCPEIPSGAGRVVTGRFLHQARSTITLTIVGQSEPIECTGNHPFWSEDRQIFVRADSLQPNETLRTATGLTTVKSWTPDLNPTPVYNIEVHGAHVYHVGTSGVVVHNPGGLSILDCPHFIPDDYVTLYHGSATGLKGGIFNLGAAASNIRPGTPRAGVYLTDDFHRAFSAYGRNGTISSVTVPRAMADQMRQLGGPLGNQVEFFTDNVHDIEFMNRFITELPALDAFQLWIKGRF
jgi:hypothetical protein